jgi:hypothetical protein
MTNRTFLLGLGAQKAGTTWLHRYLLGSPAFRPGAMKEYHVWNAIYRTDEDGPPALEGEDTRAREELRSAMVSAPSGYFDHFAQLLAGQDTGLTADLTPVYSALPEEALSRIRSGFEARHIGVKALFLIRDPVERCWSAARMYRRKGIAVAGLDAAMPEAEFVLSYSRTEHAQNRSRYEQTIAAMERIFEPEQAYIGVYEDMFELSELGQMSDFLGIECREGVILQEHNVSPKRDGLDSEILAEMARSFAETLSFCRQRFPKTQQLWRSYALLS